MAITIQNDTGKNVHYSNGGSGGTLAAGKSRSTGGRKGSQLEYWPEGQASKKRSIIIDNEQGTYRLT